MWRRLPGPLRRLALALAWGLALTAPRAGAHAVKLFATIAGGEVVGYAYASGGGRLKVGKVILTDPEGTRRHETDLGADGAFRLPSLGPCEHRLHLVLPDGHEATFTIAAPDADAPPPPDSLPAPPAPPGTGAVVHDAALEAALAKYSADINRQLEAMRSERRWLDALAGLGWVVGIWGIVAWLRGRAQVVGGGGGGDG